jgi:hypothetical protein
VAAARHDAPVSPAPPPPGDEPRDRTPRAGGAGGTARAGSAVDPVLARRRRLARAAEVAQRVGYALFGLAVVLFVVGFAIGLTGGLVTVILVALGVGSVLLAPAIVVGYAVKAADREDRERGIGR